MRIVAYLDANSVSLVTSAIVAGFAGIVVLFKMGFRRILAIFSPSQRAALRAEKQDRAATTADE